MLAQGPKGEPSSRFGVTLRKLGEPAVSTCSVCAALRYQPPLRTRRVAASAEEGRARQYRLRKCVKGGRWSDC